MIETKEKKQKGPNSVQDFFSRLGVLGEFLSFLGKRKQFWLIPLVVIFLLFALIVVLGNTPVAGQFIYTLF